MSKARVGSSGYYLANTLIDDFENVSLNKDGVLTIQYMNGKTIKYDAKREMKSCVIEYNPDYLVNAFVVITVDTREAKNDC